MLSLVELPDQLEFDGTVGLLDFTATLDLALLDDIEVLALVTLVEHILVLVHVHHLESINQLKFFVLLQRLKELDLVKVLQVDVATSDRVYRNDLLEDVA